MVRVLVCVPAIMKQGRYKHFVYFRDVTKYEYIRKWTVNFKFISIEKNLKLIIIVCDLLMLNMLKNVFKAVATCVH